MKSSQDIVCVPSTNPEARCPQPRPTDAPSPNVPTTKLGRGRTVQVNGRRRGRLGRRRRLEKSFDASGDTKRDSFSALPRSYSQLEARDRDHRPRWGRGVGEGGAQVAGGRSLAETPKTQLPQMGCYRLTSPDV